MMDILIEILDKVGNRVEDGRIYQEGELDLDLVQPDGPADAWHVPVKVRSHYASIQDIKTKLLESHPDLDGKNWSMQWQSGGVVARWEGGGARLSCEELSALERDHVLDYYASAVHRSYDFSCDKAEWPEPFGHGPVRITPESLKVMQATLSALFRSMLEDELSSRLDDMDHMPHLGGHLFVASAAALELARRKKGRAAFVRAV